MKYLKLIVLLVFVISCDEIIEVEDISNEIVTVLAPTDGSVLNITNINFSWDSIADAETYRLQIATPDFETAIQIIADTTMAITSLSNTLELGNYQWRVRAENSDFQTPYTTQSFTIE